MWIIYGLLIVFFLFVFLMRTLFQGESVYQVVEGLVIYQPYYGREDVEIALSEVSQIELYTASHKYPLWQMEFINENASIGEISITPKELEFVFEVFQAANSRKIHVKCDNNYYNRLRAEKYPVSKLQIMIMRNYAGSLWKSR